MDFLDSMNSFYTKSNLKSFKLNLKTERMKRNFLNILTFALIVTTIGFIIDSDAKEPSMLMRFVEFF